MGGGTLILFETHSAFKICIYLFIWLHWVLVSVCSIFGSSMQTLSYSVSDLFPWPGSLHWKCSVLATGPQGSLCSASWICKITSFAKFGKFSAIISSDTFSNSLLLLLRHWWLWMLLLYSRSLRFCSFCFNFHYCIL